MLSRITLAALAVALCSCAEAPPHHDSHAPGNAQDPRQLVRFPDEMKAHTLSNMRDHLLALEQIDAALSRGDYEAAASLAEQRLGMSSLEAHGAAHLAPFMPEGMRDAGTRMHRAASRFAIAAQDAAVSSDPKPALGALSEVMQQCVACHAAYRLH